MAARRRTHLGTILRFSGVEGVLEGHRGALGQLDGEHDQVLPLQKDEQEDDEPDDDQDGQDDPDGAADVVGPRRRGGDDELVGREEPERGAQLRRPVRVARLDDQLVRRARPEAAQHDVGEAGVALVGLLGADGPPEDAVQLHGLGVLGRHVPEDVDRVGVDGPHLDVPRGAGQVVLALVKAAGDGPGVADGARLRVEDGLAAAPVEAGRGNAVRRAAVSAMCKMADFSKNAEMPFFRHHDALLLNKWIHFGCFWKPFLLKH